MAPMTNSGRSSSASTSNRRSPRLVGWLNAWDGSSTQRQAERILWWTEELSTRDEPKFRAGLTRMLTDWPMWAQEEQLPPAGSWSVWLLMGGRGSGKTRAGAEWVRAMVLAGLAKRVALVGPTLSDVREVMIEGASGLRALPVAGEWERPRYESSRRRLVWDALGAEAYGFSAEDPDSLRGPQFDAAWCDEIGAWKHGQDTWDMLRFGLRLGRSPRVVATTTPRSAELLRGLVRQSEARPDSVIVAHARTAENAHNLAPGFIEELEAVYGGTRLALQELEGEMVDVVAGALWMRSQIEGARIERLARYERVVVAVDPPAGVGRDACGIVAAGLTAEGVVHVLEDASARGLAPLDWAARAVSLARRVGAGVIVAEANQGGEMVRQMLELAGSDARVQLRHAGKSKRDRAEPVSGLYQKGRVKHAGVFRDLEDEMCAFIGAGGASPDRLDALVWAVAELVKPVVLPRVWWV